MVHLTSVRCVTGVRKEGGEEEAPRIEETPAPGLRTEHTCCCLGVLVGVSLIAALVAVILTKDSTVDITVLRQVHVLMSHGERTPSERELAMLGAPPPDHVFAPYGAGAMTNEGKMLTYEMGALLRKRYNEFLGPLYVPETSLVIVSDTELSKMTALLISAGLWPPAPDQVWKDTIDWQPIPYTYPPRGEDFQLYEQNCQRYNQEKQRILKAFTDEGLLQPYREFFQKLAHLTSTNFSTPQDAYHLNNLFLIQDDIKVANPKWAKHVKRKLMDIARLEYLMMFHNNLLKKLSGGALLRQIISEAQTSTAHASPRLVVRTGTPVTVAALLAACVAPPPRLPDPGAALLFELHEKVARKDEKVPLSEGQRFGFKYLFTPDTVVALLAACVAPPPRLPDPGAALLFELHEKVARKDEKVPLSEGQRFGFKIYYWDDDSAEPRLMEVPGCSAFCPLETFKELTKYIVSHNYSKDCKIGT